MAQELEVEGDSQLVVRQMLGEYKVKTERLKPLHAEAQKLARGFHSFQIRCGIYACLDRWVARTHVRAYVRT